MSQNSAVRCVIRCAIFAAGLLLLLGLAAASAAWFAPVLLAVDSRPVKSDSIVALSGDILRLPYAAELYHRGLAPEIVITSEKRRLEHEKLDELGIPFPRYEQTYRDVLLKLGVPDAAIRTVGKDLTSTVVEAEAIRAAIPTGRTILIVTSAYHTRRTQTIFSRLFTPDSMRVVFDPGRPLRNDWWTNRRDAQEVVLEFAKWAFYLAGGRF